MGELLGLTWDCIDVSEKSIKENKAYIYINKELQRVKPDVLEVLNNKDVILTFSHLIKMGNTVLVLKLPKTKTSVRKVFLPTTVAQRLVARKQQIDGLKVSTQIIILCSVIHRQTNGGTGNMSTVTWLTGV